MAREIRLGTAVLGFRADVRQYLAGLTSAEKAIRKQQRAVYRMRRSFYQLQRQLSRTATSMTSLRAVVISLFGGGLVVRTVADFEQGMATVAAISGTTGRQLEALRAKALQLGATMPLTATQAAEGMQLLARAGFSAREVFDAIPGTLNLAIIGQLELGRASDIASNILTGFSIAASEQNRVTDVLAKTTTRANTNIQQLGDAMKFVAPIAQTVGVTLEETSAALGLLGDAGLQGTIGGTGFRRFLLSLEAPTKLALQQLESIGLSIDDVRVSTVGLEESLRKLAPLATSANLGKAFNVFGARGTPAFVILARFQEQLFEFNQQLLESEGYADEVAAVMKNNLSGAFKEVRSALEGLAIAVGDLGITDALTSRLQTAANVIRAIIAGIRDTTHDIFPDIAEDSAFAFRFVIANLNILRNAFILLGFVILRHTNLGKFIINTVVAAARTYSLASAIKRTRENYVRIGKAIDTSGQKIRTAFNRLGSALFAIDQRITGLARGMARFFVGATRRLSVFRTAWNTAWTQMRQVFTSATQGLSLTGLLASAPQALNSFFVGAITQVQRFRVIWNTAWLNMYQVLNTVTQGATVRGFLANAPQLLSNFFTRATAQVERFRLIWNTSWSQMRQVFTSATQGLTLGGLLASAPQALNRFFAGAITQIQMFRQIWNLSWTQMRQTFTASTQGLSLTGVLGDAPQVLSGFFARATAQIQAFRVTWSTAWLNMRAVFISFANSLTLGNFVERAAQGIRSFLAYGLVGINSFRAAWVNAWNIMGLNVQAALVSMRATLGATIERIRLMATTMHSFFTGANATLGQFRGIWNAQWQAMTTTFHSAMGIMGNAFRGTIATMLSLLQILKVSVAAVAGVITRIVWPLAIIEGLFLTISFVKDLINSFSQLDVSLGDVIVVTIGELVKFVIDTLGKIPVFLAKIILGTFNASGQAVLTTFVGLFNYLRDLGQGLFQYIEGLFSGDPNRKGFFETIADLNTAERINAGLNEIGDAFVKAYNLLNIDSILPAGAGEAFASTINVIGGVDEETRAKIVQQYGETAVAAWEEFASKYNLTANPDDLDKINLAPSDLEGITDELSNVGQALDEMGDHTIEVLEEIVTVGDRLAEDLGMAFGNFAKDVILDFDNIEDAAKNLANAILSALAERLIAAPIANAIAGSLGQIFGGIGFLQGAAQHGGRHSGLTLVGEAGPEVVDFRSPARVYTNERLRDAIAGEAAGAGGVNLSLTINSADAGAVERAVYDSLPYIVDSVKGAVSADMQRPSSLGQSIRGV